MIRKPVVEDSCHVCITADRAIIYQDESVELSSDILIW